MIFAMNLKLLLTASVILEEPKQVHPQSKQQFFATKKTSKRNKVSKIQTNQEILPILSSQTSLKDNTYEIIKRLQSLDVKQLHYSLAQTQDPDVLLQFKAKQPKKKKLPSRIFSTDIHNSSQISKQFTGKSQQKKFKKIDNLKNSITIFDQGPIQKQNNISLSDQKSSLQKKQKLQFYEPKKLINKTLTSLFSTKQLQLQQHQQPDFSINDFHIIKQIGQGTYSKVYQVSHKKTGFICALKILQKSLIKQLKVQYNAIRQIKILSCLSAHPNITTLYGSFYDNQKIYLILELCTQGDLHQKIKKLRIQNQSQIINTKNQKQKNQIQHKNMLETVNILKQICFALKQLHQHSIMHRDIKPENILVTMGNNIKISDFGWSVYNPKDNLRKTLCGTPLYLAPQFITSCRYNDSIDVWSLGIMAYQLFSHQFPFKIQSINDLIKIVKEQINFSKINCEIAKDFCKKTLVRDYRERADIWELCQHELFIKYIYPD